MDPDSADDERACAAFLSSHRGRPSTRAQTSATSSKSRSTSRTNSKRSSRSRAKVNRKVALPAVATSYSRKRRAPATTTDEDGNEETSDETDYESAPASSPSKRTRSATQTKGKAKTRQTSNVQARGARSTSRSSSKKKVRVVAPSQLRTEDDAAEEADEEADGETSGVDDHVVSTRARSRKGKDKQKAQPPAQEKPKYLPGTSKLTKAQLLDRLAAREHELEELKQDKNAPEDDADDERDDTVADLRHKLREMSEANQIWEARARLKGWEDSLHDDEEGEDDDHAAEHDQFELHVEEHEDVPVGFDGAEPVASGSGSNHKYLQPSEVEEPGYRMHAGDLGGMDYLAGDVDFDAAYPEPTPPAVERGGAPTASTTTTARGAQPHRTTTPTATPSQPAASAQRKSRIQPFTLELESGASRRARGGHSSVLFDDDYTAGGDGFDVEYPRLGSEVSEDDFDGKGKGVARLGSSSAGRTPLDRVILTFAQDLAGLESSKSNRRRAPLDASSSLGAGIGAGSSADLAAWRAHAIAVAHPAASSSPLNSAAADTSAARRGDTTEPSSPLASSPLRASDLQHAMVGLLEERERVKKLEAQLEIEMKLKEEERARREACENEIELLTFGHHEDVASLTSVVLSAKVEITAQRTQTVRAPDEQTPLLVSHAVQTSPNDAEEALARAFLRILSLEEQLERAAADTTELEAQRTDITSECEALRLAERSAEEERKKLVRQIEDLQREVADGREALAAEKRVEEASHDVHVDELEANLKQARSDVDRLNFACSNLRDTVDKTQIELERCTTERNDLIVERDGLVGERDTLVAQKDHLATQVDKHKSELTLAKQQLKKINEFVADVKASKRSLEKSKQSLEATNQALEATEQSLRSELEHERELSQAHKEADQAAITGLTRDVFDMSEQIVELKALQQTAEEAEQILADFNAQAIEVEEFRRRCETAEGVRAEVESKVLQLDCAITALETRAEEAEASLHEANLHADGLKADLLGVRDKLLDTSEQLESVKRRVLLIGAPLGLSPPSTGIASHAADFVSILDEIATLLERHENTAAEHLDQLAAKDDLLKSALALAQDVLTLLDCENTPVVLDCGDPSSLPSALEKIKDDIARLQAVAASSTAWEEEAQTLESALSALQHAVSACAANVGVAESVDGSQAFGDSVALVGQIELRMHNDTAKLQATSNELAQTIQVLEARMAETQQVRKDKDDLAIELNHEKARHSATLSGIAKLKRGIDDVHATGTSPLSTFGGVRDAIAGPSTSTWV
ncbi:hypothetical protein Rhopal_002111-T1 [Rhodotorula paludigena]|uniref:Uncharacterized protein n=1 Tax=Rhodotorula paludigena TaxID=86838 RepID=A0AAV5GJ99_9BASI|nr:hypothetical protein Rhopal_002111-T1 [Rhodotorula paludigena]